MRITENAIQNTNAGIQPPLGSSPDGGCTCFAADVERTFGQMLQESRRTGVPFCLISSVPPGAEGLLRARLVKHPLLKRFTGCASPVAFPTLYGSQCSSKDIGRAIYEALTLTAAQNASEPTIWRQARAQLRLHGTFCLMIGQFENALVDQSAQDRRRIFQNLARLMQPHDGTHAISLVLTGSPQLTKALAKEAELLPRAIIMPVVSGGAN